MVDNIFVFTNIHIHYVLCCGGLEYLWVYNVPSVVLSIHQLLPYVSKFTLICIHEYIIRIPASGTFRFLCFRHEIPMNHSMNNYTDTGQRHSKNAHHCKDAKNPCCSFWLDIALPFGWLFLQQPLFLSPPLQVLYLLF